MATETPGWRILPRLNSRVHIVLVMWHYLPFTKHPIMTSFTLTTSSSLISIFGGALKKHVKEEWGIFDGVCFVIWISHCTCVAIWQSLCVTTGLCLSYNTRKTDLKTLQRLEWTSSCTVKTHCSHWPLLMRCFSPDKIPGVSMMLMLCRTWLGICEQMNLTRQMERVHHLMFSQEMLVVSLHLSFIWSESWENITAETLFS